MYRTFFLIFLLAFQPAWASEDQPTAVEAPLVVETQTPSLPNIVLIIADDLGWNDLGYQGSEIHTPHIDALAASGVRLNRFYVQPQCTPTRASLLTGKSSTRLGLTEAMISHNPKGLPLEEKVMPEYLKGVGYQTALVGKWHLGFHERDYLPTSRGFDTFYGHLTGGIGYWNHLHAGRYDWQRLDADGNAEVIRDEGYATHLIAQEAVSVIEKRKVDEPLFLYAAFNAPHLPNDAPDETLAAYDGIESPHRRAYAAMVTELDGAVGNIVDALEQQGMLDNTLIWFMSDNGGTNVTYSSDRAVSIYTTLDNWFGETRIPINLLQFMRDIILTGGGDNTPLRNGKRSFYEGGVRVPGFLYWRDELAAGEMNLPVTVQDILPSILGLIESKETDAGFDGANRWPLLRDGTPGEAPDFVIASGWGEALIRYPWKVLRHKSGDIEFFNIEEDPSELENLAESETHAALRDELLADLDAHPRGEPVNLPAYQRAWYVDYYGDEEVDEPWLNLVQ
ncbi:MAG: arylsulfatase [Parvibaculaceae bacterium]|nr:arylsulfatase [Parvibaculaceae bacterium]HBM86995.1 sulfatase [Rhodobiaceae bacterium]|tara:strand:- start:601 stop:2124 length:1524 start_codon:yes stop_codon:yes gene_type:complete